jgi:PKD repeat protein
LSVTVENVGTATGVPYWWQFGDGPVYNGNVLPPQVLFDGVEDTTYILRLSVPNGCGPATVEKPIVVRARPKARLGLVYPEPCSGSVLEASVLSVGNAVQNTWYTSTGQVVTGSLIQPSSFQFYTDSVVRVVDVWLVTTNACGSDTAYGQVVVKPAEVAAQIGLADSRPRCAGAEFSLLNFSTPGASVYWTLSNGAQYLGDSIRLAFDDPGTYAVTLHAFGCGYDSVIFPLVVHPQPELDWQYPLVGCPGDTLVFKLLTDAEGSVLRFGDGDSTFNRMVSHVYRTSGVYHPQVEVVTALGCKDKLEGSLEILPVPSVMAESADSVCGGQAVRFEGAVTGPVASSWWEFGGAEVLPGSVVDYTFDGTGVFGVVFHATSDLGCSASDTVSVYVRDYAEAIIAADISQGCAPVEVSLMRTGAGVAGVVWDLGNGQVVVGNTAVVTYSIPGTYEVMLVTTNGGICPDTALLTVKAGAAVQYDLDIAQACLETEGATLTIRTDAANLVRVGGPAYTRTGVIHPNLPEGVYTVGIQSAEGCRADTVVTVLGNDELYLTVVEDSFAILLGDSVFLQAVVNQPGVAFRWSPVPGLSRTDAPLVVARPARTTRYVVEATNAGGCVKWDTVFIRVDFDREAGVFLPNAFTPNGDGVNDIFYLRSSSPMLLGIDYFRIYDLYNETVFDVSALSDGVPVVAEDPRFGWDGNFRGSKAELGSYRYTLAVRYIDGYLKVFTGTVQLIR